MPPNSARLGQQRRPQARRVQVGAILVARFRRQEDQEDRDAEQDQEDEQRPRPGQHEQHRAGEHDRPGGDPHQDASDEQHADDRLREQSSVPIQAPCPGAAAQPNLVRHPRRTHDHPHLTASVRHVLQAATLARIVHNTQPWRFVTRDDGFDLLADADRRLGVLDPTGRQLHLSCGAALVTARTAARALGLDARVELLAEPADPGLLARLTLVPGLPADDRELALALAVLRRHTVRTCFEPRAVPDTLLHELQATAEAEGAVLRVLSDEGDLVSVAVLLSGADWAEERDPACRREVAAWIRDGDAPDGIPRSALPSDPVRGSLLRSRDFTLTSPERLTGEAPPAEHPAVVVLTTSGDGPRSWLAAGQAMGALLLQAAAHGVQAQPLGQVVDLPGPRWALRGALGLTGTPQMVLRMGYAAAVASTPRRGLEELLV